MLPRPGHPLFAYGAAGAGLILDQATKWLTELLLRHPGASVSVLPPMDLLRFTYVTNTGGAWGLMEGFRPLFILVGALVSAGCVWVIHTHPNRWVTVSASLLLGGSLGNTFDRLFLRTGVVDFVDMGLYGARWPTFNVADMMITVGILLLLRELWQGEVVVPTRHAATGGE